MIYIGGGSMRNLLAIWRAHGLDVLLAEAWERGIVLAGLSAGAMCWFEGGITRSSGPPETIAGPRAAARLAERARRRRARAAARRTWRPCGRARCPAAGRPTTASACCSTARGIVRAVSSRPGAAAQRVDAVEGELVRARIEPELLGAAPGGMPLPGEAVEELRAVAAASGGR